MNSLLVAVYILAAALLLSTSCATLKFVDLTHPYANRTTFAWPSDGKINGFWIKPVFKEILDANTTLQGNEFWAQEHSGTHIDAPHHFFENGWSVDQLPIDRMIGVPAVVVDISKKAETNPDATLDAEDLVKWEEQYGRIPDHSVILMNSGYGVHYTNFAKYVGSPTSDPKQFHFPGFGPSGAKWLTANRDVYGIGVDTASADAAVTPDFKVHRELLKNNYYLLENVANVHLLDPTGWKLHILPIKLEGGTGGPTRIVAYKCNKEKH